MHGFSSLPLQRFFLISAESPARSKVFGVGSVCKQGEKQTLASESELKNN
jgi:hypothetical protein